MLDAQLEVLPRGAAAVSVPALEHQDDPDVVTARELPFDGGEQDTGRSILAERR